MMSNIGKIILLNAVCMNALKIYGESEGTTVYGDGTTVIIDGTGRIIVKSAEQVRIDGMRAKTQNMLHSPMSSPTTNQRKSMPSIPMMTETDRRSSGSSTDSFGTPPRRNSVTQVLDNDFTTSLNIRDMERDRRDSQVIVTGDLGQGELIDHQAQMLRQELQLLRENKNENSKTNENQK